MYKIFCNRYGLDPEAPIARDLFEQWERSLPCYYVNENQQNRRQDIAEVFVIGVVALIMLAALITNC